jgi:hypothetical protein
MFAQRLSSCASSWVNPRSLRVLGQKGPIKEKNSVRVHMTRLFKIWFSAMMIKWKKLEFNSYHNPAIISTFYLLPPLNSFKRCFDQAFFESLSIVYVFRDDWSNLHWSISWSSVEHVPPRVIRSRNNRIRMPLNCVKHLPWWNGTNPRRQIFQATQDQIPNRINC